MSIQRCEEKSAPSCGRESEEGFGSSFYMFFVPPGLSYANWALAGALFVLPEVLTPVLGPFFVLFSRAFPFFVF